MWQDTLDSLIIGFVVMFGGILIGLVMALLMLLSNIASYWGNKFADVLEERAKQKANKGSGN